VTRAPAECSAGDPSPRAGPCWPRGATPLEPPAGLRPGSSVTGPGPAPVLWAGPPGALAACLPAFASCHPGGSCPDVPPGGAAAVLDFRSRACRPGPPVSAVSLFIVLMRGGETVPDLCG